MRLILVELKALFSYYSLLFHPLRCFYAKSNQDLKTQFKLIFKMTQAKDSPLINEI